MTAIRTQIEDAVMERLKPLLLEARGGDVGGYLQAIRPYLGEKIKEFRRALSAHSDDVGGWGSGVPGILVTTWHGAFVVQNLPRTLAQETIDIHVNVCSGALRSMEARTRGGVTGDADPGVYAVLEDARKLLFGWRPDIVGVGPLRVLAELPLETEEEDLCIWRLVFTAEMPVEKPAETREALTGITGRIRFPLAEETLASGTGDNLAVDIDGETVTLTDAGAAFLAAHVGELVKITGAAHDANNGEFTITARLSATAIQFTNANAVAEVYPGAWFIRPQPVLIEETNFS